MNQKKQLTALLLCTAITFSAGAYAVSAAETSSGFSDVDAGSWYGSAVEYCVECGLMEGQRGKFSPDDPMTRAGLTAALYRAEGSPQTEGECLFSDVPEDAWYAGAARWAGENGIVSPDENGGFTGGEPVSRQEAVTLLWRCAGSPQSEPSAQFKDGAEIDAWAEAAVNWAQSLGIIAGFPNGHFLPQDSATRAQAAEMLMRFQQCRYAAEPEVLYVTDGPYEPLGITAAEDGALLICDTYNKVLWQVENGEGTVYAGGASAPDIYGQPVGGYYDGSLEQSLFGSPWTLEPFLDGYAVSDPANNAIRLIRNGTVQSLNCTSTERRVPNLPNGSRFTYPTGLAAGDDGCLYVSDTHENAIRKINAEGVVTTLVWGLSAPTGLCWKDGALYVAETGANRILKIEGRKVTYLAGNRGEEGFADGSAREAAFSMPQGVAVDDNGVVYVADTGNSAVRRIQGGIVSTICARDVTDIDALYPVSPTGMAIADGTLYVCDDFARMVLAFPI